MFPPVSRLGFRRFRITMTSETKVSAMDAYSTTGDSMVPRSTIQQLMYALCVAFGGQSNQKTSVVIIIFKSSKVSAIMSRGPNRPSGHRGLT